MPCETDSPSKTKLTHGSENIDSTGPPTEKGAHQPDPEDPLRANEWPHIRVHVPRTSRPEHDGPCARARDSSCGFLRSLYSRIAADLDEPPVRAALGLVLAVVVVALSAVLAPVALFKAVLVAVAGLTGRRARPALPRPGLRDPF
jgi:hypothetical protein